MEDLGILVRALAARRPETGGGGVVLDLDAARAMFLHDWPLNIRELERRLGAAIVLAGDGPIRAEHVFLEDDPVRDPSGRRRLSEAPSERASRPPALGEEDIARREELRAKLEANAWNVSAVAREMGKARMQIQRWMKRYDLKPGR
jgi:transcriptional regulator with GAF, ATPase, and Fis domain